MIYLLEDDDSIRKLVLYGLDSQGFQAKGFALPSEFWRAMDAEMPELVLLDIMLPEEDGLSILRKLRARPATKRLPIIMLTAKNSEYDRVIGLDHGADDFVSKPFSMLELIARIRAVLRRAEPAQASGDFSLGLLFVSPDRHEVKVGGKDVTLTNKEFELLCLLLRNKGIVLTRATLMDRVWGFESERENRTLDVHIRTLRVKLGEAGSYIETVRGIGYKIGGETA
ncbi:MAG: response regulator transcription factor [Oscillospiraceae bacterium]|nr:response regulator transcription factor [Oscillospiraceae bacterium]